MDNKDLSEKSMLVGTWVGDIFGTWHCPVYAEISLSDKILQLDFRIGLTVVRKFIGVITIAEVKIGNTYNIPLREFAGNKYLGSDLNLALEVITEDLLDIEWEGLSDSKGRMRLQRYLKFKAPEAIRPGTELLNREYKFHHLKIYKPDIEQIIEIMRKLTGPEGNIWVTEGTGDTTTTLSAKDYLTKKQKFEKTYSLLIEAQKDIGGFLNSLSVLLTREEGATLKVHSTDFYWTNSISSITELLQKKSNLLTKLYKKLGLNVNFLAFIILLVWLPKYPGDEGFKQRIIITGGFLCFAFLHKYFHQKISLSYIDQNNSGPINLLHKYPVIPYTGSILLPAFAGALVTKLMDILL